MRKKTFTVQYKIRAHSIYNFFSFSFFDMFASLFPSNIFWAQKRLIFYMILGAKTAYFLYDFGRENDLFFYTILGAKTTYFLYDFGRENYFFLYDFGRENVLFFYMILWSILFNFSKAIAASASNLIRSSIQS